MKSSQKTRILIESAMMIALSTVLSIFKIIEMPYGGSVTVASMLPMVVLAYRHGIGCGLTAGFAYAALQQLLGLNTLSYVTGWQSIVAIILLDYIVAFTVVGLGGIYRSIAKSEQSALVLGTITVAILRYVCHVISGATVWAGLSIPTEAALIYSIGYNATYMLPETIITAAAAYYLASLIDFKKETPSRRAEAYDGPLGSPFKTLAGATLLLGLVIDIWMIAPCLQDEETGEFILHGLSNVDFISLSVVTAITIAVSIYLFIKGKKTKAS
jgi:thiamine transporter